MNVGKNKIKTEFLKGPRLHKDGVENKEGSPPPCRAKARASKSKAGPRGSTAPEKKKVRVPPAFRHPNLLGRAPPRAMSLSAMPPARSPTAESAVTDTRHVCRRRRGCQHQVAGWEGAPGQRVAEAVTRTGTKGSHPAGFRLQRFGRCQHRGGRLHRRGRLHRVQRANSKYTFFFFFFILKRKRPVE